MTGRKSVYLDLARELDQGVNIVKEKLRKDDLPLTQQHWAMFSVLEMYLCLWQCYEALKYADNLKQVCQTTIVPEGNDAPHLLCLSLPH